MQRLGVSAVKLNLKYSILRMTGKELFEYYLSKRDFSSSEEDQYAQNLMTIWTNLRDEIYALLEKAESTGKRLGIRTFPSDLLIDEINVSDIIFE